MSCSWIRSINIVKWIYDSNSLQIQCISYLITKGIFYRTRTKTLQFLWKHKRPWIAKQSWEEKMECSYFRLYYKAIVIKILWYWHKNWNTTQWNKIESPERNPYTHGHLIFDKGGKNTQWRKDSLLDKWCCTCKRMKLGHLLTLYKTINSNGFKT